MVLAGTGQSGVGEVAPVRKWFNSMKEVKMKLLHNVTGHNVQCFVNAGIIQGDIHQVINEHSLVDEEVVRYCGKAVMYGNARGHSRREIPGTSS
jgi:hypothetical protein